LPWFCYVEITNMDGSINHTGIVEKIEGSSVFVRIVQKSACSGCHAKHMCSASEQKDKIIEVPDHSGLYHLHEEVMITGKSSMGLQAVFIAFVLPLIFVIALTAFGIQMNWDESISGLFGLSMLIPYYGALYLFRKRLKKRFVFTLKKLN